MCIVGIGTAPALAFMAGTCIFPASIFRSDIPRVLLDGGVTTVIFVFKTPLSPGFSDVSVVFWVAFRALGRKVGF